MKDKLEHYDSIQDLLGDLGYSWNVDKRQFERGSDVIPHKDIIGETVPSFINKLKSRGTRNLVDAVSKPPEPVKETWNPFIVWADGGC